MTTVFLPGTRYPRLCVFTIQEIGGNTANIKPPSARAMCDTHCVSQIGHEAQLLFKRQSIDLFFDILKCIKSHISLLSCLSSRSDYKPEPKIVQITT